MKVSLKFVFDEIGGVERELTLGKAQFSEIDSLIEKVGRAQAEEAATPLQTEIAELKAEIARLKAPPAPETP